MMQPALVPIVFGSLVSLISTQALAGSDLPDVTSSGYLTLNKSDGSEMFYAYYEAEGSIAHSAPILLWLQVQI